MHLEHPRDQGGRVKVTGYRPCHDHFARAENCLTYRQPVAGWRRPAGLFLELPDGRLFIILAPLDHALDNRPGTVVPSCKEWPAGMGDHHFEPAVDSVGKKTR